MKSSRFKRIAAISLLVIRVTMVDASVAAASSVKAKVGEQEIFQIADLHPAQGAVGMSEVKYKSRKLRKLKHDELKAYSHEKPAQVVIGPDHQLYLIDGHHKARALWDAGEKKMEAKVVADLSDLSEKKFWEKMQEKGWAFLFDENGKSIKPADLPEHVKNLADDPYRTLAWLVREAGGYKDADDVPFQEFRWADLFRKTISFDSHSKRASKKALIQAMQLAHSSKAAGLPGYAGSSTGKCDLKSVLKMLVVEK